MFRVEVPWPPFLPFRARRIDPMIVLTPELEVAGLVVSSGWLRRSVPEDDGRGGDGGAIIVIYDSAGAYSSPRIKLPRFKVSGAQRFPWESSLSKDKGALPSRAESEKLPLRLCAWLWKGKRLDVTGEEVGGSCRDPTGFKGARGTGCGPLVSMIAIERRLGDLGGSEHDVA